MGVKDLTQFGEMLCVVLAQTVWLVLPSEECVGKRKTSVLFLLALKPERTRIKNGFYYDYDYYYICLA